MISENDVLFAKMKNTKKVIIGDETNTDYIYSTGFYCLTPNKDIIVPKLLYYFLNSPIFNEQKDKNCTGATMKGLNDNGLKNIELNLPNYEKQNIIVAELDKLYKALDNRKQCLEDCATYLESKFYEMFGDIYYNKFNWEIGPLSNYFKVKGGKRIPKGMTYSDKKTSHVYLRATDMKNGTIIDNDIKYISDDVFDKIKNYTVNTGDLYLTNVGVNLGMAGVIPQKYDGANLTENAVKLVPLTKKLDNQFMSYYLNSRQTQCYIEQRKMSVGVPKLAIFRIETMPIIVPPIDMQQKFSSLVDKIQSLERLYMNDILDLEQLIDSKLSEYFK